MRNLRDRRGGMIWHKLDVGEWRALNQPGVVVPEIGGRRRFADGCDLMRRSQVDVRCKRFSLGVRPAMKGKRGLQMTFRRRSPWPDPPGQEIIQPLQTVLSGKLLSTAIPPPVRDRAHS